MLFFVDDWFAQSRHDRFSHPSCLYAPDLLLPLGLYVGDACTIVVMLVAKIE